MCAVVRHACMHACMLVWSESLPTTLSPGTGHLWTGVAMHGFDLTCTDFSGQ